MVLFSQTSCGQAGPSRGQSIRSRVAMASTLDRLGLDDTIRMIDFRWRVASAGKQHPLRKRHRGPFRHSAGIAREIITLAGNAVLLASWENRKGEQPDFEEAAESVVRRFSGLRKRHERRSLFPR